MGVVRAQNLPLRVVCQDYAVVYFASQQLPLSFGKLHDEEPLVALQELQSFLQHLCRTGVHIDENDICTGVYIDENLTWECYVNELFKKIASGLSAI